MILALMNPIARDVSKCKPDHATSWLKALSKYFITLKTKAQILNLAHKTLHEILPASLLYLISLHLKFSLKLFLHHIFVTLKICSKKKF